MVNSLRYDFSHPTGHYTWEIFRPPLEEILGAPLLKEIGRVRVELLRLLLESELSYLDTACVNFQPLIPRKR